jgi:hypothetical protein
MLFHFYRQLLRRYQDFDDMRAALALALWEVRLSAVEAQLKQRPYIAQLTVCRVCKGMLA